MIYTHVLNRGGRGVVSPQTRYDGGLAVPVLTRRRRRVNTACHHIKASKIIA